MKWPTPKARDTNPEGVAVGLRRLRDKNTCNLATAARFWPTPSASKNTTSGALVNKDGTPWNGTGKPHSVNTGKPIQTALADAARIWPTPTRNDAKNVDPPFHRSGGRGTPCLGTQVNQSIGITGGQLNPTWVEWLMGWPLGWTDLKPLATDRFRQWRLLHGGFCAPE